MPDQHLRGDVVVAWSRRGFPAGLLDHSLDLDRPGAPARRRGRPVRSARYWLAPDAPIPVGSSGQSDDVRARVQWAAVTALRGSSLLTVADACLPWSAKRARGPMASHAGQVRFGGGDHVLEVQTALHIERVTGSAGHGLGELPPQGGEGLGLDGRSAVDAECAGRAVHGSTGDMSLDAGGGARVDPGGPEVEERPTLEPPGCGEGPAQHPPGDNPPPTADDLEASRRL